MWPHAIAVADDSENLYAAKLKFCGDSKNSAVVKSIT